jgi:hypothetical protein
MGYSWRIYRAMWDEEPKGYVYAHNEAEARQAWTKFEGDAINAMVEIDDVEFYVTSPEEGGFILFLHPDEIIEYYIEPDEVNTPHVFYCVREEEEVDEFLDK